MKCTRLINLIVAIGFLVSIFGCGQDLPFEYQYLSANQVQIKYQGQEYVLNRWGGKVSAPFDYEFESDGDLDIMIGGKVYDIDSPYDIDKSKKKSKKIKKKKTKKKRK